MKQKTLTDPTRWKSDPNVSLRDVILYLTELYEFSRLKKQRIKEMRIESNFKPTIDIHLQCV